MSWDLININSITEFPVIVDGFVCSEHVSLDDFISHINTEFGCNASLTLTQWVYEADLFINKKLQNLKINIEAESGCDLNGVLLHHYHKTKQAHLFVVDNSVLAFQLRGDQLEDIKCYCSESVALEALIRKGYFLLQAA
jgi:hypothetical protein